jgi:hypothetical protein
MEPLGQRQRPLARTGGLLACGAMLLLGGLAVSLTSPSKAAAAEPGVATDLTWGISPTEQQRTVAAMTDVGAGWARVTIGWHDIEPSKGSYSSYWLADLDRAVQLSNDAGIKLVLNVIEAPQWASGSTDKQAPPRNPQDLAEFMRFIANRYSGTVEAYEIWNEENGSRFWPAGPSPVAYTEMLKAAYVAIKATDPSATVVFGGMAQADYRFVEAAYAAGAKGYFDVMAVHPYTCWEPEFYYWVDANEQWKGWASYTPRAGERMTKWAFLAYREVRKSMLAAGDDKPIWFTELGWSTANGDPETECVVSEATQAAYLTRAFEMVESDPYVQVVLWYNFRQDYWNTSPTYFDGGFGLMRADFTPKPAYAAFRSYATSTDPAPPPNPTPTPDPTPTPEPTPTPTPAPLAPPPNEAPTISLLKPVTGQTFSRQFYFTAQAGDDQGVARVDFLIDGKRLNSDYAAPFEFSWRVKKTSYGKHTVLARAYDGAGLSASDSTWVTRVR